MVRTTVAESVDKVTLLVGLGFRSTSQEKRGVCECVCYVPQITIKTFDVYCVCLSERALNPSFSFHVCMFPVTESPILKDAVTFLKGNKK
jgi:hypothetical protein